MEKKVEIKMAMEDDLFRMLEKWGELGKLDAGELKCICGEKITRENLTAIKPHDGKIVYLHSIICNSL